MRFALLAPVLAAAGIAAAAAHAQQTPPAAQQTPAAVEVLPVRTLLDRVEAQGYRDIRQVEREDDHYEVKATDAEGRRVKLKLDAHTGALIKAERK